MKPACVNCFKTLSVSTRFKILGELGQGKLTISDLIKTTSLRQPTITFHINQLVKSGLVAKHKIGREVYCQITKKCHRCQIFS